MHIELDMDLDDVDPNGVCEDQTAGGAGALTLDGAGVVSGEWITPDGHAKQVGLESSGNLSGVTFTIVGFQDLNRHIALSEDVTGPNATTVESSNYFAVITGITVDGAVGTNVEIGPVDEAISKLMILEPKSSTAATVSVDVDGSTIDFTVQETFKNVLKNGASTAVWSDITALTTKTANTTAQVSNQARAIRVKVNSYSSGGRLLVDVIQPLDY